jgi:hypothetical protein
MAQKNPVPEIGDAAVKAKTGKTWAQWFTALEKAGARGMSHKEIVALLARKHDVSPWWQQMVTVAYERHAGKRKLHEKPEGFEISRSRTLAAPVAEVFEAWGNARRRASWLPGEPPAIRKATENRSLRMTWADGTNVEVMLYLKGPAKTQVAVQHGRLGSARAATKQKAYWGDALDRLAQLLKR